MKKVKTVFLCVFALGLSISSSEQPAGTIEKKVLVSPNSTSHVFQMPIKKLKDTLVALFRYFPNMDNPIVSQVFHHYYSYGDTGYWSKTWFHPVTAKKAASFFNGRYFEKPNTENDIFLQNSTPWDSPLYHTKGTPLAYIASFVLKLKSTGNNYTQLTIEALNPCVYNGFAIWDILLCNCGIFPGLRTKAVQATTIEEHVLLLFIAEQVGDNSVEPLKMPQPLQNVIAYNRVLPVHRLTTTKQ